MKHVPEQEISVRNMPCGLLFPVVNPFLRRRVRVVITKQKIKDREYRVTALFEDHQMLEVSCDDVTEDSLLGNIYIGKIRRIVEKIGAAFVEIAPGMMTYLPLEDAKEPLMVKQLRNGRMTEEDELVVQVVKEAVKTKDPTVSTQISLKGNALIFTTQDKKLGVSRKLEQADQRGTLYR